MSTSKKRINLLAMATVAATATALTLVAPATPGHAVGTSTFEETDGNFVVNQSGKKDWVSFADRINCQPPYADCALDKPTGQGDDSLGMGSKDDHSTMQVTDGGIPNNKSDLSRLYVADERVGSNDYLYIGWVRNNTLGTANFSIELNKIANGSTPTVGSSYTIQRTAGDLLVLYDFAQGGKADTLQLRLSKWVTSGSPKTVCQANSTVPCWGKTVDLSKSGIANGSVNKVSLTDGLYPEPSGGAALAQLTFGEAAINLTAAKVQLGGCGGFGQAMIRSRSSSAFNAELKDFIAPAPIAIDQGGAANTSGWSSDGTAMTDRVFDTQLVNPAVTLGTSAASNTNPSDSTPSEQTNSLAALDVPPSDTAGVKKGGLLHVDLLTASATSAVSATDTTQTSIARVAGVNILDGIVTASVVEATALTRATDQGAIPSTGFSGLKDLKVDLDGAGGNPPIAMNNVGPNTRIDLSEAAFGPGSYVELRRQNLSTDLPAPGTPLGSNVTYDAYVNEITMIHVHVTDRTPDGLLGGILPSDGDVTTDVQLANATAHSHSAGILCRAAQAVEGHATVLRGNVGNLIGASIGNTSLPDGGGGGAEHQGLDTLSVGSPALVTAGVSTSDTQGSWTSSSSNAGSSAQVARLCVQLIASGPCEIGADVLESHVSSTSTASSWSSTGGSSFVNLVIAGMPITVSPNLVQEIPGIGLVILDERICGDGSTPPGSTCTTGGPSSSMTVRALHIFITELLPQPNLLGLKLGSEIVIAESQSGATFVSAG